MKRYQIFSLKLLRLVGRLWRQLRGTEWKIHPIDKLYGIETSGKVSRRELWTGSPLDAGNVGYVGMQPSLLRICLDIFPIAQDWAFIDLGCGKGRALAVATEYPFGHIVGIELSPLLYEIAKSNGDIMAASRPSRPVNIVLGDATQFDLPECSTAVLFLYNSFIDERLVQRTVDRIENHLSACPSLKVFVVYYNPVYYQIFDNSHLVSRFFARKIEFSEAERLVAPMSNTYDSIVIYQSTNGEMRSSLPGAGAPVRITVPRLGAEVVSQ